MSSLPPNPADGDQRPIAVLIHGIASSRWLMWPLAKRLRKRGYDARLWSYFTLRGSNRQLGQRFAERLAALAEQHPDRAIHIVAHSMGSIVTRCAATAGLPENLGRIVMLGPPNRGSHVARQLMPLYGWFCTTLGEITDRPSSFVNQLAPRLDGHEVGIIALQYDRVVRLESTHLENQTDHLVMPSWHTGVLWRSDTAEFVDHFLRTGRFAAKETSHVSSADALATA